MNWKLLVYKIKRLLVPSRITSDEYVMFLKHNGIRMGGGNYFFSPSTTNIDIQRPWLLKIGNYCKITKGVTILSHDYSRSVLRRKYGEVIAEAKETIIGDNVFIGIGSTILMGSHVGDNVIIGAGSVVTGNIPSNSVASGVPAKILCSLDEYYKKRKQQTISEACLYVKKFFEYYNRYPLASEMGAFFPLFLERSKEALRENNIRTKLSGDNEKEIVDFFLQTTPDFPSFDAFLQYAVAANAKMG